MKHPSAVTACNLDLENLVTDSNRSIATLAITTLLKTGSESSIDRLMKQISTFMSEISDEFKARQEFTSAFSYAFAWGLGGPTVRWNSKNSLCLLWYLLGRSGPGYQHPLSEVSPQAYSPHEFPFHHASGGGKRHSLGGCQDSWFAAVFIL